ncbi:MAG: RNA methyltransferase [Chloroflexi bacterium]|nr:RNA methyltransferase [Chloroflexota bacterium]
MADSFEIRVCKNPECGLRYPLVKGHPFGERCPLCLGSTLVVITQKLTSEPISEPDTASLQLEVLLDNVRSAWNVGAIFRTSDGFGIQKIYLGGITPTPKNPSVAKTALGADANIPWVSSPNALNLAQKIKSDGSHLWALEQDPRAIPLYSTFQIDDMPIVLIVGNEVSGVDPGLLDICERIIYIPMLGKKRSLNVEVAFGVAISALRNPPY